ncbi:hypothetical protein SADUNF_Sadunf13G0074300 [Salix dunnii]|uniref:BTB domain-containing protein n=1 Tax=Salix dunnii TaxID=1413687 RepID=A0A835JKX8_9ROSI|nr:hypothetical protein SADUNF_Sadunf13G0074300 [Salix dunnii]
MTNSTKSTKSSYVASHAVELDCSYHVLMGGVRSVLMEDEEVALIQLRYSLSFANFRFTEPSSCILDGSMFFLMIDVRPCISSPHAYMAKNFATSPSPIVDMANLNWCLNLGAIHHMTTMPPLFLMLIHLQCSCSFQPQPFANIQRWMIGMKDTESELNEKISFLSGFIVLLKDQILTDIQLKPGNDGPSISAHRALLAARSGIFKNMLDSDACKAPASDTIMLPELNHQELESLLDFLYSGSLPSEKLEKHVYALTLAADKYDIPYLLKFCERHMLRFLNSSNALDVLEISDACSNKTLKETALNFIVKNMEDVVFSTKYEAFVPENPHLAVQITRALLMDAKNRRVGGV